MVSELEREVMIKIATVEHIIDSIRRQIAENIDSEANIGGCLQGSVDDYMTTFDAQTKRM